MKLLKKIIVLAIIILIIIVIILVNLLDKKNKEVTFEDETGEEILTEINQEYRKNITQVKNANLFYTVSRCIQMYFTNSYYLEDIQENNNIKTYDVPIIFYPISMNYIDGEKVQAYSVYGYIENSETGEFIKDLYCIIYLDRSNKTFSIEILDETNITNINEINLINNEQAIAKNDYNTFRYIYIKEEDLADKYLSCYKRYAMKYPEKAYNLLSEQYRNARFGSIEAYKEYVNNNLSKIEEITLDKYQVTKYDDYTQYVCIDTNGNYYIFHETATMQYTMFLDTYTIDIPEFMKKYTAGNEQTKVGMNIQKIVEALNSKDYKYIYGKLADGFKNNYFKTQAEFETYVKNNFYDENIITYNDFTYEGQNYMYSITIKNNNGYSIDKTIIMQLKDNNDFVFSFNV